MHSLVIAIRLVIIMLSLALSLAYYGSINLMASLVSRSLNIRINRFITDHAPRRIFALLSTYMGFTVHLDRSAITSLPENYLLVCNHQSLLDIPLLMYFLGGKRLRFVAKKELGKHVPCVSRVLRTDGHCLVARTGSPSRAMREMDRFMLRVQKNNFVPVIFPEGTRSKNGELGTFHLAGFRRLLDQFPQPVVFCAIDGGWRTSSLGGLLRDLRDGFYRVRIVFVASAPRTKEEQIRVMEAGKEHILKQLVSWRLMDTVVHT